MAILYADSYRDCPLLYESYFHLYEFNWCPSDEEYGLPSPRVLRDELSSKNNSRRSKRRLTDKKKRSRGKKKLRKVFKRARVNFDFYTHCTYWQPLVAFQTILEVEVPLLQHRARDRDRLSLLAILWVLLFIAEKCSCYSWKSLSVRLLSLQALEDILIAAGDVEENPGPTFFDDKELTEICDHHLVEDDAPVVIKTVSPIAGHYFPFLHILGLPESRLVQIKAECHDIPQECLQKGIICLLKKNFNTGKHGPLTWRRLVEAIAHTAGGDNHTLARKIAAEHKGLPDSLVDRERESLKPAPSTQQKYKQSGSFAVMFPKLIRSLERSVKPNDLKQFLRYFSNPAFPDHCLIDKQLYSDAESTSQILDSLHPTYINPANLLLLQEIVDNFGFKQSKRLLRDYKTQWE